MSDRELSMLEVRCITAHSWLRARGSCHTDHVPMRHRRGLRVLLRRGLITQTADGVYQMPGVL